MTPMLYACENVQAKHHLVRVNRGTPTSQRAPGEATGGFALESAMDELAYALNIDPVELRLINYAEEDPHRKLPWSSKSLRECDRAGAEKFGWNKRKPASGEARVTRMVGGIGMALEEATIMDPRLGRIVNPDLAEYHVPVNADVPHIDAFFVEEVDLHANEIGVKGIGEIGIVGASAAIANAIYHATGKRIRDLPITPDKLL